MQVVYAGKTLRAAILMARYCNTPLPYFWKLKWRDFIYHYSEVAHLSAEEAGGADNPSDQSTWQNIMPPTMSGPPPTEEDFIVHDNYPPTIPKR